MTHGFQLNSKCILLTWPRCGVPLQDLLDFLWSYDHVQYVCVSSELHQDGSLHRHALVQFSKPYRTRDPACFDFQGFHPNVQGAKKPAAALAYVKKCEDFIEKGNWVEKTRRVRTDGDEASSTTVPDESTIKAKATDLELVDFLIWAATNKVQYAPQIHSAIRLDDSFTLKEFVGVREYLLPEFVQILQDSPDWDFQKALIIQGQSGCGKSHYAKTLAPKPALWVTHIEVLRRFKSGYHKSIIFDDCSFKHLPRETQIHLVNYHDPVAIHCRYNPANIPANVPRIFTCNMDCLDYSDPAIARRISIIYCSPLEMALARNKLNI